MARPKTDRRNAVKTQLTDEEYEALQAFRDLHGIQSDSLALSTIARLHLLGVMGRMPTALSLSSTNSGQSRTAIA